MFLGLCSRNSSKDLLYSWHCIMQPKNCSRRCLDIVQHAMSYMVLPGKVRMNKSFTFVRILYTNKSDGWLRENNTDNMLSTQSCPWSARNKYNWLHSSSVVDTLKSVPVQAVPLVATDNAPDEHSLQHRKSMLKLREISPRRWEAYLPSVQGSFQRGCREHTVRWRQWSVRVYENNVGWDIYPVMETSWKRRWWSLVLGFCSAVSVVKHAGLLR